jgi:hypothetical protein
MSVTAAASPKAVLANFFIEMSVTFSGSTMKTLAQKGLVVATLSSGALTTLSLLTTLARAHLPDVKIYNTPQEKKLSVFSTVSIALALPLATLHSLSALGFACEYSCLLPVKDIPATITQPIELLISPETTAKLFNAAALTCVNYIRNSSLWTAGLTAVALGGTLYSVYSRTSDCPTKRWLDRFAIISLGLATVISLSTAVFAKIHSPKMA